MHACSHALEQYRQTMIWQYSPPNDRSKDFWWVLYAGEWRKAIVTRTPYGFTMIVSNTLEMHTEAQRHVIAGIKES